MKNKIKITSFIFLFFGLILVIGGISYAFFNYTEYSNSIITNHGQVYMKMNKDSNNITLNTVFPETYEEALYVNGEGGLIRSDNTIEFTIIGKNTNSNPVYYEVDLQYGENVLNKTRIDDKYLRFELSDITDLNNIVILSSNISYESFNDKKLYIDTISNNDTNYSKTYRLRMWYDENILISDTDPEADFRASNLSNDKGNGNLPLYTDLFASVKVKVYGDFNEKTNALPETCFIYEDIDDNSVRVSGYDDSCGSIIIVPRKINGKTVTETGTWGFISYNDYVTDVILPDTLTKINRSAFQDCYALRNVSIPEGVTIIDSYAFQHCTSLTNIEFPSTLTTLGSQVFAGNINFKNLYIPANLTNIAEDSFLGKSFFTSIVVDPNNPVYDSRNNCNAIIETDTNTIIKSCDNTVIPSSVTTLGFQSITPLNLTRLDIPINITTLSYECIGLSRDNGERNVLNDIYFNWTNPSSITIDSNFLNLAYLTSEDIIIHVPAGTKSLYESIRGFQNYNIVDDN